MSDNKFEEKKDEITSIHTLEGDLASAIMDNDYGKNIIKIVTDPKKKLTLDTDIEKNKDSFIKKNLSLIIKINIFILVVLTILYILYKIKNTETIKETTTSTETLNNDQVLIEYNDILNPEIIKSIDFTKLNRDEVVFEINKIRKLLIDSKITPNNNIGINSNLNIKQFFEKIKYSGDDALLRSFEDFYAFGFYSNEKNQLESYLLIKIDNFDLTFKSILNWEKYMYIDLKDIFIGNNEIINLSNTSTSSPTDKKYYKQNTKVFVDRILKNYDIREYVDNSNNTDIIYGFINNKFLLITSGESSFLDIKNRLLKENISR